MSLIDRAFKKLWRVCKTVPRQMLLYWGGRIASFLHKNKNQKADYPIDFVVTWLDDSDPAWVKERQKYTDQMMEQSSNSNARFRDWGTIVYWFRAVEKYAPWVNHVYLVTCGHKPPWLNLQNDKLRFVTHEDFMPKEYLPTFNSCSIELNMWRIPGLSEHFVSFNDDMFVNRPVKPEDFFENGLPRYCAIARPIFVKSSGKTTDSSLAWKHMVLNDYSVINSSFNIRKSISHNPSKWFSYVLGTNVKYNRRLYYDGYLSGMAFPHVSKIFVKKTFEELWDKQGRMLDETSRSKFRSSSIVSDQLAMLWAMFSGDFSPAAEDQLGKAFVISSKSIERITDELLSPKHNVICINDGEGTEDSEFDDLKQRVLDAFSKKLSEKSSFEL